MAARLFGVVFGCARVNVNISGPVDGVRGASVIVIIRSIDYTRSGTAPLGDERPEPSEFELCSPAGCAFSLCWMEMRGPLEDSSAAVWSLYPMGT